MRNWIDMAIALFIGVLWGRGMWWDKFNALQTKCRQLTAERPMDKEIPTKVEITYYDWQGEQGIDFGTCPICGVELHEQDKYCPGCGQNLEWR